MAPTPYVRGAGTPRSRSSRWCSGWGLWVWALDSGSTARPRPPTKGFVKDITGHLKDLNPIEATAVGVLKQPWTLTAAAAVIVVRHHSAVIVAVAAFLLFTLASTATVALTYLYYARRPGQAEAHLSALRTRVVAAGPTLVAAVSMVVGVFLVADGVVGLLGS